MLRTIEELKIKNEVVKKQNSQIRENERLDIPVSPSSPL